MIDHGILFLFLFKLRNVLLESIYLGWSMSNPLWRQIFNLNYGPTPAFFTFEFLFKVFDLNSHSIVLPFQLGINLKYFLNVNLIRKTLNHFI